MTTLPGKLSEPTKQPPIIEVAHVYKRYPLNEYKPSLRHEPVKAIKSLVGIGPDTSAPFWALQDVSFQIQQGESVGIIGSNGAGKSTLFRLMCHISSPTRGEVQVNGNYAALIALGAGFIPERTGLENIYLNAAIYGKFPRETRALIEEIVAFSELESFIHLPVKRYSSGMVARLGFSVAVHLAPDILFVDEVLAVGDTAFQQKCTERIRQMKNEGRTLMFVSHRMAQVTDLCERAIWLDHGKVVMDDLSKFVVVEYENAIQH